MSLLLLGGSSFVGAALRHEPEWPPDAHWTYQTRPGDDPAALALDLRDAQAVAQVIRHSVPTQIIDCTIFDDPAESARIYQTLCTALQATVPSVRYVLVSTDAVFSGQAGRLYREDDRPDPPSPYGQAKAAAETQVLGALPNACVARTCLVYGRDWNAASPAPDKRIAAALSRLQAGEPVAAFADQYRTPTDVADLAPALLRLALGDERGIFHLAGPVRLSRADFTREVARAFHRDAALVADQPLPANPVFGNDVGLDIAQTRARLGWSPVSPQAGLARLAATLGAVHG